MGEGEGDLNLISPTSPKEDPPRSKWSRGFWSFNTEASANAGYNLVYHLFYCSGLWAIFARRFDD